MVSNKKSSPRKGHRGDRGGEDPSDRLAAGGEHSPSDIVLEEWRADKLPLEVLPGLRAWLGDEAAGRFPAVIKAIDPQGRLPQRERAWIAQQLIGARGPFEVRTKAATLQPKLEIQRLRKIESSLGAFFRALGINAAPSPDGGLPAPLGTLLPTMVDVTLQRRGEDRDAAAIDVPTLVKNMKTMLTILWDLSKAVGRDADVHEYNAGDHGHGGKRQDGPRSAVELLHKLFWIYDGICRRRPASGPGTAWSNNRGGVLDFVRACLKMIAPELGVTTLTIRDAFYTWRNEDARLRHTDS
jgi:hypothetical protein